MAIEYKTVEFIYATNLSEPETEVHFCDEGSSTRLFDVASDAFTDFPLDYLSTSDFRVDSFTLLPGWRVKATLIVKCGDADNDAICQYLNNQTKNIIQLLVNVANNFLKGVNKLAKIPKGIIYYSNSGRFFVEVEDKPNEIEYTPMMVYIDSNGNNWLDNFDIRN